MTFATGIGLLYLEQVPCSQIFEKILWSMIEQVTTYLSFMLAQNSGADKLCRRILPPVHLQLNNTIKN